MKIDVFLHQFFVSIRYYCVSALSPPGQTNGKNPMHAIALPYSKGHVLHVFLAKLESVAEWLLLSIVRFVAKSPWILALMLLITFGFTYTILAYVPLTVSRRINKRLVDSLMGSMKDFEQRQAMLFHLEVEDTVKKLNQVTVATRSFFVFRPLISEFKLILLDNQRLERALFAHAYPDFQMQ